MRSCFGVLRVVLVCVFLFCFSSAFAAPEWRVVFFDGFDSGVLDRSKWATRYIYKNETLDYLNDEIQRYRDNENHLIDNGVLNLVARYSGNGQYESGMIRSKQTFMYGYFEARVYLPNAKGVWPAFWLNSDYDKNRKLEWPPEIDVFEFVLNGREDKENMFHSSVVEKGQPTPSVFLYSAPDFDLRHKNLVLDYPINSDWHVAGLVWDKDSVTMFWDGRRIYTRSYSWVRLNGDLAPPAHVLLNFAVGGKWAGRHGVDEKSFPQYFKIDYVKVCQRDVDDASIEKTKYNVPPSC